MLNCYTKRSNVEIALFPAKVKLVIVDSDIESAEAPHLHIELKYGGKFLAPSPRLIPDLLLWCNTCPGGNHSDLSFTPDNMDNFQDTRIRREDRNDGSINKRSSEIYHTMR